MNSIRFWRLERRLSQIELAEASGLTRWFIQLIESGIRRPNEQESSAIAEALGVTVNDLGWEG